MLQHLSNCEYAVGANDAGTQATHYNNPPAQFSNPGARVPVAKTYVNTHTSYKYSVECGIFGLLPCRFTHCFMGSQLTSRSIDHEPVQYVSISS
jgi:hypothetical protein